MDGEKWLNKFIFEITAKESKIQGQDKLLMYSQKLLKKYNILCNIDSEIRYMGGGSSHCF